MGFTVLHLDSGREMRGGQWQVLRLMRGLRKRGHKNLLLARAGGALLECAMRESFDCDALGVSGLLWVRRLAEVVHAHDARSHAAAALLFTRPIVVSRRVVFPVKRGPLSRWKYKRATMFAAVSETAAEELRRAGVPKAKIRIVHDGVPLLNPGWSAYGSVLIPRSRDRLKLNDLALRAAHQAEVPVIRTSDLEADLNGASLLVYLTAAEALGSAALLAMSAGVPVIASDVGGLREIIQHGRTGLLVPNEMEPITDAIRILREQPELARELAEKARARIVETFSEDCMVEETLRVYETATARSKR